MTKDTRTLLITRTQLRLPDMVSFLQNSPLTTTGGEIFTNGLHVSKVHCPNGALQIHSFIQTSTNPSLNVTIISSTSLLHSTSKCYSSYFNPSPNSQKGSLRVSSLLKHLFHQNISSTLQKVKHNIGRYSMHSLNVFVLSLRDHQ